MVILMEEKSNLEEAALKRKERLQALKRKKDGEKEGAQNDEVIPLPKPKFRSYNPENDTLKEKLLPQATPADISDEIKEQLESAKTKVVMDELDITNLAPRKPDWDLKRDVAKKLDKLERRTQKAIAELIRERLKQQSESDLAQAVNAGAPNYR